MPHFLTGEEAREVNDKRAETHNLAVRFYCLAAMRIDRWRLLTGPMVWHIAMPQAGPVHSITSGYSLRLGDHNSTA